MRAQRRIQRVHADEHGRPRGGEHVDQRIDVARIRDEPVLRTGREVRQEVHRQREDVIQRDRGDDHLVARAQRVGHERFELRDVRDEVAMRQRRALRQPGRAARVLQQQQIVAARRDGVERTARAVFERVGECDRRHRQCAARRVGDGHDAEIVGPDGQHRADPRACDHVGQRAGRSAAHDDRLDARVVELMFELARGIERIDVHLHRAELGDGDERDRKRRHVRQHHRDAIAAANADDLLKIRGERGRQPIDVRIGQRACARAKRGAVGKAAHRVAEHRRDRCIAIGVDLRGNRAVRRDPGSVCHDRSPPWTARAGCRPSRSGMAPCVRRLRVRGTRAAA